MKTPVNTFWSSLGTYILKCYSMPQTWEVPLLRASAMTFQELIPGMITAWVPTHPCQLEATAEQTWCKAQHRQWEAQGIVPVPSECLRRTRGRCSRSRCSCWSCATSGSTCCPSRRGSCLSRARARTLPSPARCRRECPSASRDPAETFVGGEETDMGHFNAHFQANKRQHRGRRVSWHFLLLFFFPFFFFLKDKARLFLWFKTQRGVQREKKGWEKWKWVKKE